MIFSNYGTSWLNFQLWKTHNDLCQLPSVYGNSPAELEEYVVEERLLLKERAKWLHAALARPAWTHFASALLLKAAQAVEYQS
jgi:hypothetical protein